MEDIKGHLRRGVLADQPSVGLGEANGSEFGVGGWGLAFGVWGLEFGVWGLGVGVGGWGLDV